MKTSPFAVKQAVALACCYVACVQAQPNIGDVIRQVPDQAPIARPQPALPAVGGAFEPPMRTLPQGGASIVVKQIQLVDNRQISTEELLAQLPEATGKRYTLQELELLAAQLTRYYRSMGYFVARVYIPAQEVKDGALTLRVIEGRYGQFKIDNKSLADDTTVQGIVDDIKKYDVVSLDTIERAMLILNDTPGVQVIRADILPGEQVGSSDFAIGTVATVSQQGYVLVDNYGSRYTGRDRVSFGYDWNSPSGSGDRASVSGLGSTNGNLLNGRAAYSSLLSYSGWRGELAASQTTYSLGDSYKALDALGTAVGYDLALTYPIQRIRAQTIEFGLSYAQRDLKDQIRSTGTETRKSSQTVSASLSLRDETPWFGLSGITQGLIRVSQGTLNILDAQARSLDQALAGARTHGDFTKVYASLSRATLLPEGFTLTAQARRQLALNGKNLDGSERMGIAGVSGVAAYPMGESSGTDATLFGLDLSQPLPSMFDLQQQWQLFTNWGTARTLKENDPRTLSDIGLGWNARSQDGMLLKVQVARRTSGKALSEPDQTTRVLLQAGWVF